MSVNIIKGTNTKPVSSQILSDFFTKYNSDFDGQLFIGYPIIGTPEGRFSIDALWISPKKGLVVFDLVEGREAGDFAERQDEAANLLESKLRTHRYLVRKRQLLVNINTVTFAPAIQSLPSIEEDYLIAKSIDDLYTILNQLDDWQDKCDIFHKTLSAIQSISTIRKAAVKRIITKEDSRGAKLKRLEDSIATLDTQQGQAVIETVEGVQRIRGLAGSGKTIVLALKAAYLHAQHPEWRIAVTFHTRSLKEQFRRLINTFCIDQTGEEPDWDNLRVVNAWGAHGSPERDGIYHEFCKVHDIQYYDFRAARYIAKGKEFEWACKTALDAVSNPIPRYDAILVDEAQDFPPCFLRLCYEFLNEKKRLTYAYDELQSLSGASLPSPEEIFGKNPDGSPRVKLEETPGSPRRDIILPKCYRNSRPVLVTAHAMGFGIYRTPPQNMSTGLVQMFDHPNLWEEVGYKVIDGELKEGRDVTLVRPEETSPHFLEDHSPIDDLVIFKSFSSEEEQTEWVVQQILQNLKEEELRYDDIVVIHPDPLTTREKVGQIRKRLYEMGINSHLAGVDTEPDVFFRPDSKSITFTGIYRAKGNEAGMVYIINAHDCQSSAWNLASIRNRLFTAITRSKAWVRVLGIGEAMDKLIEEYEKLKAENFKLRFRYPTQPERERLRIIHRDLTADEKKRLDKRKRGLTELIADLEAGRLNPEDLDDQLLKKMQKLLFKGRTHVNE